MKQSQSALDAKSLVEPVMGIRSLHHQDTSRRARKNDLLSFRSSLESRLRICVARASLSIVRKRSAVTLKFLFNFQPASYLATLPPTSGAGSYLKRAMLPPQSDMPLSPLEHSIEVWKKPRSHNRKSISYKTLIKSIMRTPYSISSRPFDP